MERSKELLACKGIQRRQASIVEKNEHSRTYQNFQPKHALIKKGNYSSMKTLIPIRFWGCNIVLHLLQKLHQYALGHINKTICQFRRKAGRVKYTQLEE